MDPPYRLHGQGWQFDRNAALSSGVRRRRNPPRRAHDFRRKYHRPFGVVSKCALSEFWDRAHYPRYSTIRGNFQIVAIYKDFKEISSDNLSLHDTVKVTKENRRL